MNTGELEILVRREARSPLDMSVLDEMLDVPVGCENISDGDGFEVGSSCHHSALCGIVGSEVKSMGT